MSLKHFDLFKHWLRGLQGFSPRQDARQWMEEELPEEQQSWRRFSRVVYTLFLRQLQQQLAGRQTGFLWLLLEPLAMIILFTMMHTVIRGRESSTYDIIIFMGSGIVPFFLFRTILTSSMKVFKKNRSLYQYNQIKPFDALMANVYFEVALYAVITILLLGLALLLGVDVVLQNFDLFVVMVLWLILFGASWGLLMGVLNHFYEVSRKGCLFSELSTPDSFRGLLSPDLPAPCSEGVAALQSAGPLHGSDSRQLHSDARRSLCGLFLYAGVDGFAPLCRFVALQQILSKVHRS